MGKKLSNPSIVAILFFGIVACFSWFANQNGTALPTGDSGSMIISSRALHADGEYAWPTYDLTSKGKLETTQFEFLQATNAFLLSILWILPISINLSNAL